MSKPLEGLRRSVYTRTAQVILSVSASVLFISGCSNEEPHQTYSTPEPNGSSGRSNHDGLQIIAFGDFGIQNSLMTRTMDMVTVLLAGWLAHLFRFSNFVMPPPYLSAMAIGLLLTHFIVYSSIT